MQFNRAKKAVPDGMVRTEDFVDIVRKHAESYGWCDEVECLMRSHLDLDFEPRLYNYQTHRYTQDRMVLDRNAPKTLLKEDIIRALLYVKRTRSRHRIEELIDEIRLAFGIEMPVEYNDRHAITFTVTAEDLRRQGWDGRPETMLRYAWHVARDDYVTAQTVIPDPRRPALAVAQ